MRGLALFLAAAVLASAGVGFAASARIHETSRVSSPLPELMPPDPVAGAWPPGTVPGTTSFAPHPAATTGITRILVLLIQFTDVSHDPRDDPAHFDDFFNNDSAGARSLRAYYRENSYGSLTINATIVPTWFTSNRTMAYYGQDGPTGVDNANGPIYALVTEAVRAADASVDFRAFDTDGDGVVDHLVVVHAGLGQENHANMTDLIWSHSWYVFDADPAPGDQPLLVDGVQVFRYTMISEASPLGVMAHEFGHDLDLPDLYDTDLSSDGAGLWDVMSEGAWLGAPRGSSPAEFSAWSKGRLGWLSATDGPFDASEDAAIPAAEGQAFAIRLPVPGSNHEYFLLENREPIGFDRGLPAGGLLIWHVDDFQLTNDNDAHRLLDLEEADEGISGDHPTDAGDPWHDTAVGFGPDTRPSSVAYDGTPTNWRVRDVSASGTTMTATLLYSVPVDLAVQEIRAPPTVALGSSVLADVVVRNEGSLAADALLAVRVYRDRLSNASLLLQTDRTLSLPSGTSSVVPIAFNASALGRYLIDAVVSTAGDAIGSDDERVAHVSANAFAFRDDLEAGGGNWTVSSSPTDNPRWAILNASDPNGSAHSGWLAWRFGYVANNTTNPTVPNWRALTTPIVNLTGPSYLIFYQRFNLLNATDSESPGTARADVDVRYGAGAWTTIAAYSGTQPQWGGVSIALAPPSMPDTVQVRFNATAGNMPTRGGWGIDDVAIAARGLDHGVVLVPAAMALTAVAGTFASAKVKVFNVGDYEESFVVNASLPGGWTVLWMPPGGSSGVTPNRSVVLGPDRDATAGFVVIAPGTAETGRSYNGTVTATTVSTNATASVRLTVTVQAAAGSPLLALVVGASAAVAGIGATAAYLFLRRRMRHPPT